MTWELFGVFAFVFGMVVTACVACWDCARLDCQEELERASSGLGGWPVPTKVMPPPPCPPVSSATASSPAAEH